MSLFDQISPRPSVHVRHEAAPLLHEREQYLACLMRRGVSRITVRCTAAFLVHIVRLLKLTSLREIQIEEIEAAGRKWAAYRGPLRMKLKLPGSPVVFVRVAKGWLRFHRQLPTRAPNPYQNLIDEFVESLRIKGLCFITLRSHRRRLLTFFEWYAGRHRSLKSASLRDVDDFLAGKRRGGWSVGTLACMCQTLRAFFRFAAIHGWCAQGVPLGIPSPTIRKSFRREPKAPTWAEVRRAIACANGSSASDLRDRAILLLLAVYGLRSSEVTRLQLSDFDWYGETFIVHRAKRGGIQQFPIQYEVGEAIIRYLEHGRPRSASGYLFVASRHPYGQIGPTPMWDHVSRRMTALGVKSQQCGPHSLRHACATRLLKKGSSLREIADFLGHRNVESVSIYAKYDTRSLRQVASFSMAGVL
jgi:integrase/recombinase XerD